MSSEAASNTNRSADILPAWMSVLAVVAHPDDESFGLGAILDAFTRTGARVEVLCLTHGEASTLHGVPGDLASMRAAELAAAADALGVSHTTLHHHSDGALSELSRTRLATDVVAAAESSRADGLLVFDTAGVSGHADHVAATSAGLLAAERLNLPVLGWTLPETVAAQLNQEFGASFTGHREEDIGLRVTVDRAEGRLLRVEHRGGDRFDIDVRGHVIGVDQPVEDGGDDTAPTPTELFIASLASCVAFYARRYLARHDLPTEGLVVEATFDMGTRPARVSGIDVRLILPAGVPAERRDALLAVAAHCTVHNTLTTTPKVAITLADVAADG